MISNARQKTSDSLSPEAFYQLVKALPPDKISTFPLDRIPTNIPADMGTDLSPASHAAVEHLLHTASSSRHIQNQETEHSLRDEVVTILKEVRLLEDNIKVKVFKGKIGNLMQMLSHSRDDTSQACNERIEKNFKHINYLLFDINSEYGCFLKMIANLERIKAGNDAETRKLDICIDRLRRQSNRITRLLGEYYLLRFKISIRAIQGKIRQIEDQEPSLTSKKRGLGILYGRMDTTLSLWKQLFRKSRSRQEYRYLQNRAAALVDEIKALQTVIIESDLARWLDAINDASLNPYSKNRITKSTQEALIALHRLLMQYCMLQEDAALQIARSPLLEDSAKFAIDSLLTSEQSTLHYFTRNRKNTHPWLVDEAQKKLRALKRLRKQTFAELRRTNSIYHRVAQE
ncbi:MAG: hypothetical protein GY807_08990 [Gammaproteobacteria bacterium]|nr:hypothetical protein [Gammaproteobacteria bacterium]